MKKETTLNAIEQARLIEDACARIGQQLLGVESIKDVNWAYIDEQRQFVHSLLQPEGEEVVDEYPLHNESIDALTEESRTGRIMITEAIFNEIETFDSSDESNWQKAFEVVLNAAVKKESFESDEERDDFIDDFCDYPNFIHIHRLPRNGFLYNCLSYYYSTTKEGGFEEHVRDFTTDDEYMYFTSGIGYAVISQDLLGGDATGDAVREFLNFLNGIK